MPAKQPDLKKIVALVAGASRGAGRGIAVELGAAGVGTVLAMFPFHPSQISAESPE